MSETILGNETPGADGGEENVTPVVEATETKELTTETTEDTDQGKDSIADTPEGAPESYADFTIPEGFTHNETSLAEASGIFKEIGLTQEQAQRLIDFDVKHKQADQDSSLEAWTKTMDEWRDQSASDKEFGGANFEVNIALAKKGRDAFGSEDFNQMLDVTGIGNHPEMVRFLVNIGKAVSEDNILQGSSSASSKRPPEQIMFPNM